MIELKEAYTKAHKEFPDYKLIDCVDIGNAFAFYFAPDEAVPGVPYVAVNKKSGDISYLTIPPFENLEIIREGKKIQVEE